jgi:hypothetical protein
METETPETDAIKSNHGSSAEYVLNLRDHARKMERERNIAIDALRKWDAVCKAAEECNAEMHSETYSQERWEVFEQKHGELLKEADRARIAALSILPENADAMARRRS